MPNYDITGNRYGYWTVLRKDVVHPGKRNSYWICECQCGTIKSVTRSSLVNGESLSCGCRPSESRKGINATHGMSRTRIYKEWLLMKHRCKTNSDYSRYYIDKGIKVCDEWENEFVAFNDWALSHGYSDDLTIDRIDNDKGYSPDNCRWVTRAEQARNKTNNIFVEYNGKSWCLRTLCAHVGFPYKLAHRRYTRLIKRGAKVNTDDLLAPVHSEKIALKYRKH